MTTPPSPRFPTGLIHPHAAAIDLGARQHFVCVPEGRDPQPVRAFGCFVLDLEAMAQWLIACGVTTVVLEATGVYWVPVVEMLWKYALEPVLVDPRQARFVPGRKSDVLDCQWLQQLHAHGLLRGAFLPAAQVAVWRSYTRQRQTLVEQAADQIRRMHKALEQMGVQLHKVVSDITGSTGLAIVRALLDGQRDPEALAALRYPGCKRSEEDFVKALHGHWREEHLFALRQALELYTFLQGQVAACDARIAAHLKTLLPPGSDDGPSPPPRPTPPPRRPRKNAPPAELRQTLFELAGVDLTQIPGVEASTVQTVLSECGVDLSGFKSVKHFCSWLGLCPGTRITGGRRKSSRTRPVAHRAATALRRAAQAVGRTQTALGSFYRRMKTRLGPAGAITATAHKLARLIYTVMTTGHPYVDAGVEADEQRQRDGATRALKRRARRLGYTLIDTATGEILS